MPHKTQDIARATMLYMTVAVLILMGGAGLFSYWLGIVYPLRSVLLPDNALATLMVGIGLLAMLRRWSLPLRMAALVLLVHVCYLLLHNTLAGGREVGVSWLTGDVRMGSLASAVLLLVALCLLAGVGGRVSRWSWSAVGIVLLGSSVVALLRLFLPGGEVAWTLNNASSPLLGTVLALLLGISMLLMATGSERPRPGIGRLALTCGLIGVLLSCTVWYLLNWQYQEEKQQQAGLLLDNLQFHAEQVLTAQRLAGSMDVAQLLEEELRVQLGSYKLRVLRDEAALIELRGIDRTQGDWNFPLVAQSRLDLPGGDRLTLELYPDSADDMLKAGLIPGGVALAGLMLSYLMAFSLGLAHQRHYDRRSLWESEQRYRSLFAYNPDSVFSIGMQGTILTANPAFADITGLPAEQIIGKPFSRFGPPEDAERIQRSIDEALKGHAQRFKATIVGQAGEPRLLYVTHLPILVEGKACGVFGIAKDITEQAAYERHLAHSASHDALTGLANRTLLEQRLNQLVAPAEPTGRSIAVLFVDLDDFKPINDSLGHTIGDKVLIEVARRLAGAIRPGDTLGRLGGDEFVVLLSDADRPEQERMAAHLLKLIARPYCIDQHELHLSASIGIAVSEAGIDPPVQLIQQADMAMYMAKKQGRNAYRWFTHDITRRVNERLVMRNELQEAIDGRRLELYYQPLYDGAGCIVSVEALLRWKHPLKGFVPPSDFIPLAEETGQIMPISRWVLEQACLDMVQLDGQGLGGLKVAVNLSPLQFHRGGFMDSLHETLDATRLPASRLELELTEGVLLNHAEDVVDTLYALRRMAIDVAIDDFGTGFSSLNYLKHLPIAKVKIDRSFIREVAHGSQDASIVQAIISMAHHLGLRVVAEGVETRQQHELLKGYGCEFFQGYLLARPMPLEQLRQLLTADRTMPENEDQG